MDYVPVSARENMNWQTMMSNTAHQREVADLQAAGLNPVLSAHTNGASTPSGQVDPIDVVSAASGKMVSEVTDSLNQVVKDLADMNLKERFMATLERSGEPEQWLFSHFVPKEVINFLDGFNFNIKTKNGNIPFKGSQLLAGFDAISRIGYDLNRAGITSDSQDRIAGLINADGKGEERTKRVADSVKSFFDKLFSGSNLERSLASAINFK